MSIFHFQPTVQQLNDARGDDMVTHVGIEYTDIGPDFVSARMPVDHRTKQPFGLLHGGASVVLAESIGSVAANLTVNPATHYAVGLEINANHVRSARQGWVHATARPLHIGGSTQVWDIRITDDAGNLTCISRLTMAILPHRHKG